MKVLVDTCIWSMALRRRDSQDSIAVRKLKELIRDFRVQMIGPIRQELLSGLRSDEQYQRLREYLSAFSDLPIQTGDYEKAAEFYNLAKRNGLQGSNTDFLICAVSRNYKMPIFTEDQDFSHFVEIIPIELSKHVISCGGRKNGSP